MICMSVVLMFTFVLCLLLLALDDVLLSEQIIDIDDNLRDLGFGDIGSGRSISSSGAFQLDVEYVRSLQQQQQQDSSTCMNDLASLNSLGTDRFSFATYAGTGAGAGVMYQLRVRLSNASSGAAAPSSISPAGLKVPLASRSGGLSGRYSFGSSPYTAASSPVNRPTERWDLLEELDVSTHVKCQGGQAFVSLDAAGLLLSSAIHGSYKDRNEDKSGPAPCFFYQVHSLDISGKGVLSTYPVASPSTFSRYPDTFARIQNEVDKVRAWMQLKLQLSFPPMFRVIFDADAVGCYERIFAAIMKVCAFVL